MRVMYNLDFSDFGGKGSNPTTVNSQGETGSAAEVTGMVQASKNHSNRDVSKGVGGVNAAEARGQPSIWASRLFRINASMTASFLNKVNLSARQKVWRWVDVTEQFAAYHWQFASWSPGVSGTTSES